MWSKFRSIMAVIVFLAVLSTTSDYVYTNVYKIDPKKDSRICELFRQFVISLAKTQMCAGFPISQPPKSFKNAFNIVENHSANFDKLVLENRTGSLVDALFIIWNCAK